MHPWVQTALTIVAAVFASSGFWAYLQHKQDKKDVRTQMLIGLAHDRIISLGIEYIERGYITADEHENLSRYLYKPYFLLGGNGSAERIMNEVNRLPIKSTREKEIKKHDFQ